MNLLFLFMEFFKTGLFAIGGGMATIPFLYEIASKYDWFTTKDLVDMIAISESTPGPIGVNMSTFAGFQANGILGALVATLSLVLPSYIIICFIATILERFQKSRFVKGAFLGLRPAVVGLLLMASIQIFKVSLFKEAPVSLLTIIPNIDYVAVILFALLLFGIIKFKKHPVVYIGIGALLGILIGLLR